MGLLEQAIVAIIVMVGCCRRLQRTLEIPLTLQSEGNRLASVRDTVEIPQGTEEARWPQGYRAFLLGALFRPGVCGSLPTCM
jgi:hypothetical protein